MRSCELQLLPLPTVQRIHFQNNDNGNHIKSICLLGDIAWLFEFATETSLQPAWISLPLRRFSTAGLKERVSTSEQTLCEGPRLSISIRTDRVTKNIQLSSIYRPFVGQQPIHSIANTQAEVKTCGNRKMKVRFNELA